MWPTTKLLLICWSNHVNKWEVLPGRCASIPGVCVMMHSPFSCQCVISKQSTFCTSKITSPFATKSWGENTYLSCNKNNQQLSTNYYFNHVVESILLEDKISRGNTLAYVLSIECQAGESQLLGSLWPFIHPTINFLPLTVQIPTLERLEVCRLDLLLSLTLTENYKTEGNRQKIRRLIFMIGVYCWNPLAILRWLHYGQRSIRWCYCLGCSLLTGFEGDKFRLAG